MFFIENLRKVTVLKTVQGLGLSVTGGVASSTIGTAGFSSPSTLDAAFVACSWPGLIRIKKIFPHGAAWQTGQLAVGDVLLAANGQPLTGCTNYVSLYLFLATNFFFSLIFLHGFFLKSYYPPGIRKLLFFFVGREGGMRPHRDIFYS